MNDTLPRLPRIPVEDAAGLEAIESAMREQQRDIIQGTDHRDQMRADAINAVLRAKGLEQAHMLTAYEAAKVFTILSHIEELAGYSG